MKMKVLKGLAVAMLTGIAMSVPVFAAPITLPDGTVFDPEYYAQQNPDVTAALGTDAVVLYQHYVMFGKNEGRQPYAGTTSNNTATNADGKMTLPDGTVFDPVYYAQNNPDVTAVLGTDATLLAQHYLQFGKAEGRKPAGSGSGASNANAANTANNMLVTWTCKTAQQREQDYNAFLNQHGYYLPTWTEEEYAYANCLALLMGHASDLERDGSSEVEERAWYSEVLSCFQSHGLNAHICYRDEMDWFDLQSYANGIEIDRGGIELFLGFYGDEYTISVRPSGSSYLPHIRWIPQNDKTRYQEVIASFAEAMSSESEKQKFLSSWKW